MATNLKTYKVYPIKKINEIRQFNKETGEPVLGEAEKTVRLDENTAKILNNNAKQFGKVYKLSDGKKVEAKPETVAEVKDEPKEDAELEALRAEAKELGIKGAHLIKDKEKLAEKINEKK